MQWRNPARLPDGGIDCEIRHPVHGWIPSTVRADDPATAFIHAEIDASGPVPEAARTDPVPSEITMRQALLEMADREWITEDEAMAWITRSAIPQVAEGWINQLAADPKERFRARMDAIGATHVARSHWLVAAFAQRAGHAADVDDFFRDAAKQ